MKEKGSILTNIRAKDRQLWVANSHAVSNTTKAAQKPDPELVCQWSRQGCGTGHPRSTCASVLIERKSNWSPFSSCISFLLSSTPFLHCFPSSLCTVPHHTGLPRVPFLQISQFPRSHSPTTSLLLLLLQASIAQAVLIAVTDSPSLQGPGRYTHPGHSHQEMGPPEGMR